MWVAVGFGADARGGDSGAWAKLAIAAVVAVACLFLTFTFAGKAWRALSGSPTPPPADDYTGSHSNAYVEEQDYPDQGYADQPYSDQPYTDQAYTEQDYYGTGSYGYDDTGSYGRHSSDTGSQPPYGDTGNRSAYDTGSESPYDFSGSDQPYGITGSRSTYGTPSYQPPTSPPPTSQPYYSSPPTPTSTPQSTPGYGSQGYGTDSFPTQTGSSQYQSGTYQTPAAYGRTGSRARLTQDPAATQAMPAQRQPQEPPAAQPDDEWPPRHSTRNKPWPPAEPDSPYRGRH